MKLPNGLELRNRFVLAPLTHESSNDDGTINDDVITYMAQRSSDVSLALTAASNVTDLGKAFPGQPSVAHDSDLEGLTKLATAMKQNGAKSNYPNSPWWCAITTSFNTKWRCCWP